MGILSEGEREGDAVPRRTLNKPYGAVDEPHGHDETDGSNHTDRREILHRVHTVVLQDRECCCVGQSNGWHVEGHTQSIEHDKGGLIGQFVSDACLLAHPPTADHKSTGQKMTQAQHSLRLHIFVCYDTHQRGHKQTDNTLNGIEPRNLVTKTGSSKVVAHARKISSPDGKLQEVHN